MRSVSPIGLAGMKIMVRKTRSNKGKKRSSYKPRSGVRAGALQALFSPAVKRRPGRPRKVVRSPLSPIGLAAMKIMVRARRSNKGKKRGPRWLQALPKL